MSATTMPIFTLRLNAATAEVRLRGRVDGWVAAQLHRLLTALLDSGVRFLTVDVSQVSAGESALFEELDRAGCRLRGEHGWLRLTEPSPGVLASLDTAPLPEAVSADHHPATHHRAGASPSIKQAVPGEPTPPFGADG